MTDSMNRVGAEGLYRTDWSTEGSWVDLDVILKPASITQHTSNPKRENFGSLR